MQRPVATLLGKGERLHLQHGPIDLIVGAQGERAEARHHAFQAAHARFQTLLAGLAEELPRHRSQLLRGASKPMDPVAKRMYRAAAPFCEHHFLTPMIAVAGAVADEVLAAMCRSAPLVRAYVNNGGDIAIHLAPGAEYSVAMARADNVELGAARFGSESGIGGVATSGWRGRSHSLGIADSVTVLAGSAAQADVAATLIANSVDLPDHDGISRDPASDLNPDSDLGDRLVVTAVPVLSPRQRTRALAAGFDVARRMSEGGFIKGAALFLQGQTSIIGGCFERAPELKEVADA